MTHRFQDSPDPRLVERAAAHIVAADFGNRSQKLDPAQTIENAAVHGAILSFWDELGELADAGMAPTLAPEERPSQRRVVGPWFDGRWSLAAAILPLLLIIGAALYMLGPWDAGVQHIELRAGPAERRIVRLEDGSTVSLSANSVARVSFERGRRDIHLTQGEALFEVAHDPRRPFIVSTSHGEVRAIGTAFNVRLNAADTVVTVVEGTVRISAGEPVARAAAPNLVQLVTAGQQVRFGRQADPKGAAAGVEFISAARSVDAARYTAWAEGLLRFNGEPLAEVIEEVNRYSAQQVKLLDPRLADVQIYGVLHVGDTEGLKSIVRDIEGLSEADMARKLKIGRAAQDGETR